MSKRNIKVSVKQKNDGLIPFQNGYFLGAHVHKRFKDYPFGDDIHDRNEWSPYTISRVLPTDEDKEFISGEGIKTKYYVFLFRTVDKDIMQVLRGSMAVDPEIQVGDSKGLINGVEERPIPDFSKSVRFKTRSPILIYEKESDANILSPDDDKFVDHMKGYMIFNYEKYMNEKVEGEINLMINNYNKTTVRVSGNGHSVPAYELDGMIDGPEELLEFSYLTGIGASTALGLGCWEVVD